MTKEGPVQHHATFKIAEAWRQCALDAEREDKKASPSAQKLAEVN